MSLIFNSEYNFIYRGQITTFCYSVRQLSQTCGQSGDFSGRKTGKWRKNGSKTGPRPMIENRQKSAVCLFFNFWRRMLISRR